MKFQGREWRSMCLKYSFSKKIVQGRKIVGSYIDEIAYFI